LQRSDLITIATGFAFNLTNNYNDFLLQRFNPRLDPIRGQDRIKWAGHHIKAGDIRNYIAVVAENLLYLVRSLIS